MAPIGWRHAVRNCSYACLTRYAEKQILSAPGVPTEFWKRERSEAPAR